MGVGMVRPPKAIGPGDMGITEGLLTLRPSAVMCSLAHRRPNLQLPLS